MFEKHAADKIGLVIFYLNTWTKSDSLSPDIIL